MQCTNGPHLLQVKRCLAVWCPGVTLTPPPQQSWHGKVQGKYLIIWAARLHQDVPTCILVRYVPLWAVSLDNLGREQISFLRPFATWRSLPSVLCCTVHRVITRINCVCLCVNYCELTKSSLCCSVIVMLRDTLSSGFIPVVSWEKLLLLYLVCLASHWLITPHPADLQQAFCIEEQ